MAQITAKKLEEILARRLQLKDPEFQLEKIGSLLVGNIVSPTFKGKRDHERQQMIWDGLEAELGRESANLVGMLLAYTPDEWRLGQGETDIVSGKKKAG